MVSVFAPVGFVLQAGCVVLNGLSSLFVEWFHWLDVRETKKARSRRAVSCA